MRRFTAGMLRHDASRARQVCQVGIRTSLTSNVPSLRLPSIARDRMSAMKVMTARVVDGKIDVGDAELEEGAAVAVLVAQTSDFSLSETEQEELELAVAEIRRGE